VVGVDIPRINVKEVRSWRKCSSHLDWSA
jgi:hypothetical protein